MNNSSGTQQIHPSYDPRTIMIKAETRLLFDRTKPRVRICDCKSGYGSIRRMVPYAGLQHHHVLIYNCTTPKQLVLYLKDAE